MSQKPGLNRAEIHAYVRKGYVDRLGPRSQRMRRLYAERNWPGLKTECAHLKRTAETFGFDVISELAELAERQIPVGPLTRAQTLPTVRKAVERLLAAVDHIRSSNPKKNPNEGS